MSELLDDSRTQIDPRRKILFTSPVNWPRKSRSRILQVRRLRVLPLFRDDDDVEIFTGKEEYGLEVEIAALPTDSSSSSCFHSVITAESRAISETTKRRPREGTPLSEFVGVNPGDECRRITRLYARRIKNQKLDEEKEAENSGNGVSCVADVQVNTGEDEATRCAGSVMSVSESSHVSGGFSDGNCYRNNAQSNMKFQGVLEILNYNSPSVEFISKTEDRLFAKPVQISQYAEAMGEDGGSSVQLACSEKLSSGSEPSANSSCNEAVTSEYESAPTGDSSEGYYSDLSQLLESSDDFSEKSQDNTTTSVAFSLYLEFRKEFCPSTPPDTPSSQSKNENGYEFTLLRFENEEDEESYRMLRMREKKIDLYEYVNEKHEYFTAEYCEMVIQERLSVVNWMVEHSNAVQLQKETLFLGVSLMDRFLYRGFFKAQRNLHLLGISCVTLATRLEENQPYNSVRQKSFTVGDNTYSRGEVVGMEWLVQEVLSFQCFIPTTYNFLGFYLKAAGADSKVEVIVKYLAVLSLLDHEILRFWPSTVAAGLVVLASLATDRDDSCQRIMETHVRTKNDDLAECIKSLEWLIKHVP